MCEKVNRMLSKYRTVYIGNEAEIVEKKSRFIATVKPVKNEEEAIEFIGMCWLTMSNLFFRMCALK